MTLPHAVRGLLTSSGNAEFIACNNLSNIQGIRTRLTPYNLHLTTGSLSAAMWCSDLIGYR